MISTRWAALPILTSFALCLAARDHTVRGFSRDYGPKVVMRIARPVVRWEVWSAAGESLSGITMAINGTEVDATYDPARHVLWYKPASPLQPGRYEVKCKAIISHSLKMHREWEFSIAGNALTSFDARETSQYEAIREANAIRRPMGLPAMDVSIQLSAAAMAHSRYLALNETAGHYEAPGETGFCGATPEDRLVSFGYFNNSWECVSSGERTPAESVDRLFDAPYHRIPFLQPGRFLAGAGYAGGRLTVEFEMPAITATVVSPYPGEIDSPTEWSGNERPDPLRIHGGTMPTGYPIVFCHFSKDEEPIKVKRAELLDSKGQAVACYLNSPDNDDQLVFTALLIPCRPLAHGEKYQVKVIARTTGGRDVSVTWWFVTR